MLVILMLILMLLYLNTGYADANADLCIRRIVKLSFTSLAFFNKDNGGVCCKHLYSPITFKRISIKHIVQFSFHSFCLKSVADTQYTDLTLVFLDAWNSLKQN